MTPAERERLTKELADYAKSLGHPRTIEIEIPPRVHDARPMPREMFTDMVLHRLGSR